MEETYDIPAESMQHVEALLSRHPPQIIQRMFQQVIDSRRNSIASSYTSSNSSLRSHLSSRLSIASSFSTSTVSSGIAPSVASSNSSIRSGVTSHSSFSRSSHRRTEPRSYPTGFDPTRPVPAVLTPCSEDGSPLETKTEPSFTPTEEDMNSIASPVAFTSEKGQGQSGDSFMFCTYCAELKVVKTFKAKSDWKKHEMRMHETGEDWPCIVHGCNRIFDRQKDFLKHHQRVFGCGFDKCKEVSIGWDERCDHVAKHMKNGSTSDQWKYTNVIRNLIRQEALHDTWKEMFLNLDDCLKESRSHINWCPDNTRVLRQKLQCCDLRPSREDVLIIALSLRSDIPVDTCQLEMPAGFMTPSKDSVPGFDRISREQRMHILNGNSNNPLYQARLAALNTALLQASMQAGRMDTGAPTFTDDEIADTSERRISYMELDTGEYLDLAQPDIPAIPHTLHSQPSLEMEQPQTPGFVDPGKPSNPLGWCYPNYFDAAPTFEESQYYDRPSLGQIISKPLRKIGSGLSSRRGSPHSRPSSHADPSDIGDTDFAMPIQQHPQHRMDMQLPQYRQHSQHGLASIQHDHLQLFTPQN